MAISDAIIRMAKYTPELLPDAAVVNVPLLAEVAPPILDLRRFTPYLVTLTGINVIPNPNVNLRLRYGDIQLEENTAAMLQDPVTAVAGTVPAQRGAWWLTAKDYLYLNMLGLAGGLNNIPVAYSVWAQKPTIAHKLVYGISLSADEQAIADKLGIADTVDKGLLPLPISQQIEREYYVLGEETKSRVVTLALANTDYAIENLYARANEILVLTRIAALMSVPPSVAGDQVQLIIDRDDDHNYCTIPTFPLNILLGGEVNCFVPATSEIRLHTTCAAAPAQPYLFRYTIKRIRLTNILRARFALVTPDEIPGDTYSKTVAGIL